MESPELARRIDAVAIEKTSSTPYSLMVNFSRFSLRPVGRFFMHLLHPLDYVHSPHQSHGRTLRSVLLQISIPLVVVLYAVWSMGARTQTAGLVDHLMFIVLFFLIYSRLLMVRSLFRRMMLSFAFVMGLTTFFLFIVLNFRFFHSWGQMDALKQWDDVFAIWSGIMALLHPFDLLIGLLIPLLLWQLSMLSDRGMSVSIRRPFFLLALLLASYHYKLTIGENRYSEQNPVFYVLRQKFAQMQLSYGYLLNPRRGPRRWKNEDFVAVNESLYKHAKNRSFPFLKTPLPGAKPLPFALESKPNVVLVLLESFRAFESGAYGAAPSFTPNIDRLAKEGVLLRNFYANGAQTIRGEFAIHASYVPNMRGSPVYLNQPKLNVLTLPMVLKKHGYSTYWIGSHPPTFDKKIEFLSRHGVDNFLYSVPAEGRKLGWGAPDRDLFDYALDILTKAKGPVFAEIMTLSGHFPFGEYPTDGQAPPVTGPALYQKYCRALYYTDFALGEFLRKVRQSPLAKNTVFVITGDHGIWVYPDGDRYAGRALRQEMFFRVPGLIWSPSLIKPRTIDAVSSHVDLTPSILDLLNIHPPNAFLGTSVFRDDVRARFAFMIQDNRWNLREGNDFAYDVGPEAFLSHYPVGTTLDYQTLKNKSEHVYFRSSANLFSTLGASGTVLLPDDRVEQMRSFAEEGVETFDQSLLKDRIYPSYD